MKYLSLPAPLRAVLSSSRGSPTIRHASSKSALTIPPSALSLHWDTTPPTASQLSHGHHFFTRHAPTFMYSSPKFALLPSSQSPEICLLGRSNVGKSSLLNALLGAPIAHTSATPGRTRLMNAFSIGGLDIPADRRLVVLDMPGYGKGGRAEWGVQIMRYLEKRVHLKRAFLLVDARHGIKESDKQILGWFKEMHVPFQVVLSKADRILWPRGKDVPELGMRANVNELGEHMEQVKKMLGVDEEEEEGLVVGEVLATSAERWLGGERMGVDALRFAMLKAAGLELKVERKLTKVGEIVSFEELEAMQRSAVG